MRLLTFDDDEATGRLVSRIARLLGFEAASVAEAEAFHASLRRSPPDVIALDLQLGGTDGVEQLRFLAEQEYRGSIILISGFDARVLSTAVALARDHGLRVETSLEKPIRVAHLEEVFARLKLTQRPMSPNRLLDAIENDELHLEFQPIVARTPRALRKLEALMRWDHPSLGWLSPDKFIAMAEKDVAVIDALTDWLIGSAIESYRVLAECDIRVPIAVNVSARNLHDLSLPDRLERRLRDAGMPPQHLCLELTESAAFDDAPNTMDVLTRVRLKGMQLAIDDFGIGFSSFKLLRQMPFTAIKIDKSFVSDLVTSRDSQAIAKSIIDLAANMDMESVAEGVETEDVAVMLEALNVRSLQGYLIAPPMPVELVASWLEGWIGSAADAGPRIAPQLSPQTQEVMRLLAQGRSVRQIARALGLAAGAVKVQIARAYTAVGAQAPAEARDRVVTASD
jgi:EAL domain-containing protein (putative c-di-GMP-specific phosphodiesterase class I)/FixJ family two-component response regulator